MRSEILSPEFFLATEAPGDPLAELHAALAAYAQPWPADPQQHARCRFPARFFWLSQHLVLPGYALREPRCSGLERWAQFDRLRSASLLLVSGYFGNPASTFGHALLRLNTGEPGRDGTLLDLGFNFGALIPPDEAMPLYIYRGLSGAYQAGFSDKYFYTHDQVYSRTELRDMWDYELALQRDQLVLLTLHLYELIGRKFTYYFLTKNCAYRIAELIELATGRPLTARSSVWYAPVELFHQIHAADANPAGGLIRAIRFVPSSERALHAIFAALSPLERDAANAAIRTPGASLDAVLAPLPDASRAAVLDALIGHTQFRQVAEQPEVSAPTRERMAWLLRQRLALPAADNVPAAPAQRASPATGNAPVNLGVGIVSDRRTGGTRLLLRGAAFGYDALDDHGLDGGELVVLDAQASISKGARVALDQLDLIRVRKLDLSDTGIAGEEGWSWQTHAGWRRFGHLRGSALRAQVSFAGGLARRLGPHAVGYALLEAGVLTAPGALAAQPRIGLIGGTGAWRATLDVARRHESGVAHGETVASAAARLQIARGLDLRLAYTRDVRERLTLSVSGSW
jgi:hypothetical protein